jgi:hypothetical protein
MPEDVTPVAPEVPELLDVPAVPLAPLEGVVPVAAGLVSDDDLMPAEEPDDDPIPEVESETAPLVGAPLAVPEEDAPVVPDVPELLVVPAVPLAPLEGFSVGEDLDVPYGAIWPFVAPVAEPMPVTESEAALEPLGPVPAHAASVKAAHVKGRIHFLAIRNSLVVANDFEG